MQEPELQRPRLGIRRAFWTTAAVSAAFAGTLLVLAPQAPAQNRTRESERAAAILRDVLDFVQRNYVDAADADTDLLLTGALQGMLQAVDDPYTTFVDRDGIDDLNDLTTGEFGGLGLYIEEVDGGMLVIEPFAGSPAQAAGIEAGDLIVGVDGADIGDLDGAGAVARLRGPPGSEVRVSLARAGRTLEVTVTRELIEVPTVRYALIEPDIGYLLVSQFTNKTADRVQEALSDLGGGLRSLIVDLRGNSGGLLAAVVEVADLFLDEGTIVKTRSRVESENQDYSATRRATVVGRDLPVIVLIDGRSASAAEILAGALKDHERAYLIGQRSFGKGSVQQVMRIEDDRAVKVTTARYFTPDGIRIDGVGVAPHRITEPELSPEALYTLDRFGMSELLVRFALEHPEPTEAEIRQLLADVEEADIGGACPGGLDRASADGCIEIDERMVRRKLARAIARIHRQTPIYDLVNDPSLIEAVRLLRTGEVTASSFPVDASPAAADSVAADLAHPAAPAPPATPERRTHPPAPPAGE